LCSLQQKKYVQYMPICSTVQLHLCIYRKLGNANIAWTYIDTDSHKLKQLKEEVDSDDMAYTEDAIDNMILEFSGD
jgi:hypothetical protein